MPFSSGSSVEIRAKGFNGIGVTLSGGASTLAVVELPPGTTHVSFEADVGAADYRIAIWPDPGQHGNTVDEDEAGVKIWSDQWVTFPVRHLDRPRIGVSVSAANKTLHGGDPVVQCVPQIDPVVATLRGAR